MVRGITELGIKPELCTLAKILTGGLPGGAVAGTDEVMQIMAQTGDAHHDRFQRVSHGGTFNANPYCAATGNAALKIGLLRHLLKAAEIDESEL